MFFQNTLMTSHECGATLIDLKLRKLGCIHVFSPSSIINLIMDPCHQNDTKPVIMIH